MWAPWKSEQYGKNAWVTYHTYTISERGGGDGSGGEGRGGRRGKGGREGGRGKVGRGRKEEGGGRKNVRVTDKREGS